MGLFMQLPPSIWDGNSFTVILNIVKGLAPVLPMLLILGVVALICKFFRRPSVKGWVGESVVNYGISRLDPTQYLSLKNLYIPHAFNDGTTEVDHVIVSRYGIFVIETKNYSGSIYGRAEDKQWTQVCRGQKNKFRYPLKQNDCHIRSLADFLNLPTEVFHPVVFFVGDARFKTAWPAGVLAGGLSHYITSKTDVLFTEQEATSIGNRLKTYDTGMDKRRVGRAHVARISSK